MIKEIVNSILADKLVLQTKVAKVVSVDENAMSCEVSIVGAPNMTDVRLRSVIDSDNKGVLIVPELGSYVLVTLINNKEGYGFVSGYSKVSSVRILTDNIELGGENYGGLIKVDALRTELTKLTTRVDIIIQAINQAVPAGGDGGVALQTTMKAILASIPGKEDFTNIENKNVKHG